MISVCSLLYCNSIYIFRGSLLITFISLSFFNNSGGKSKGDKNDFNVKEKATKNCKTKGKCKKLNGKCRTLDWISENKSKCKNKIKSGSGCRNNCICCLKSKY